MTDEFPKADEAYLRSLIASLRERNGLYEEQIHLMGQAAMKLNDRARSLEFKAIVDAETIAELTEKNNRLRVRLKKLRAKLLPEESLKAADRWVGKVENHAQ